MQKLCTLKENNYKWKKQPLVQDDRFDNTHACIHTYTHIHAHTDIIFFCGITLVLNYNFNITVQPFFLKNNVFQINHVVYNVFHLFKILSSTSSCSIKASFQSIIIQSDLSSNTSAKVIFSHLYLLFIFRKAIISWVLIDWMHNHPNRFSQNGAVTVCWLFRCVIKQHTSIRRFCSDSQLVEHSLPSTFWTV